MQAPLDDTTIEDPARVDAPVEDDDRRTSELLADLANGSGDGTTLVPFEKLLTGFGERAFGMLLLAVTLPSFIPLPIGVGAISGPLVALVGLQMAMTLRRPWLPRALRRRGFRRAAFSGFLARTRRLLRGLERVCRPRLTWISESTTARVLTGLLLVGTGVLLSLPIPFTNYPIGILLVLYSMALIERDGALMLVAWILSAAMLVGFGLLSEEAFAAVRSLID